MAKVKILSTFIGSPKEVKEYGGQVPASLKHLEKKMTDAEKASFRGRITEGTEMEVSDERAGELQKLGVVAKPKEKAERTEAVKEKNENAGPAAKVTTVKKAKK
jgi:hypothetical protein